MSVFAERHLADCQARCAAESARATRLEEARSALARALFSARHDVQFLVGLVRGLHTQLTLREFTRDEHGILRCETCQLNGNEHERTCPLALVLSAAAGVTSDE